MEFVRIDVVLNKTMLKENCTLAFDFKKILETERLFLREMNMSD